MAKRAYFLGAGFSKAIDNAYPTLLELTEIVVSNFLSRRPSSAVVAHFESIPKVLRGNLELMLSYLFTDWPWKTTADQELDLSLYRHLAYEICSHLSTIKTVEIESDFKILANYLRYHDHSIVTLNYDTLLERISQEYLLPKYTKLHHKYGVTIEDFFDDDRKTSQKQPYVIEDVPYEPLKMVSKRIIIDRGFILNNPNSEILKLLEDPRLKHKVELGDYLPALRTQLDSFINTLKKLVARPAPYQIHTSPDPQAIRNRILKLHGSIDWVDNESDTIRVYMEEGIPARKEKLPLIVPPILDKARHYGNQKIRDVWFDAHSALEQADEIIIIGFSFPITDLSIRYLFQSVLNRNPKVRIVIVNRDTEAALQTSYDHVFGLGTPRKNLDYSYCGSGDVLRRYISAEVIGRRHV